MKTNAEFPCVLCASPLPVRRDKHGKPYFVCDPCGMQLFIRRAAGQERLEAAIQGMASAPKWQQRPPTLLRVRYLIAEAEELGRTIRNLEGQQGFVSVDKDLERQIAALKTRKQSALAELESLCPTPAALGKR